MKTTRQRLNKAAFPAVAFALLAFCLLRPGSVKAQWTTPTPPDNNISNTNSGNVGVGTATPTRAKLQVIKGSLFNMGGAIEVDDAAASMDTGLSIGTDGTNHLAWLQSLQPGVSFTTRPLVFNPNGGWVGVGTISPASQLHIANSSGIGSVRVSGSGAAVMSFFDTAAGANQKHYQWRSEGGLFRMSLLDDAAGTFVQQNLLVANSSGNVGIGTSTPGSKLFVGSGTPAGQTLTGLNVALGGNSYVSASNGTINTFIGADGYVPYGIVGTLTNHPLGLRANNVLAVTVMPDGKVGIGNTNPTHKLEVMGDINASEAITGATINATYQDVAEWVPSEQKLVAGTVVVLDTTRSNHVLASTSSYDTKVAGVISERPGIALGEGGVGKVLVATTGRVKVKVDATKGPIKVGDLLVTGEVEGVAMKSVPVDLGSTPIHRPGTIIGKALEPLAGGIGEILVLLSLQ